MAEPHTEIITIARRWFSSLPPLQIEIECTAELAPGVKLGLAVKAAFASRAVLRGADLSGAVLSDAVLPKSVQAMRPADETEQHARIAAVAALALADDDALEMGDWHTCETTHCIAGWAVHQAGPAGYLLEEMVGPHAAGAILLGDEAAILRHTAASWMAMADVPMFQISKYLGHSDTRVTERRYAKLSPSYLKGAADALDW